MKQRMRWDLINRNFPVLLISAAVLVGVAIALDGAAAKAINGVAGLLWIATAVVLAWQRIQSPRGGRIALLALGIALVLVNIAKPTDYAMAAIGFFVGGAALATVARFSDDRAVLLLPAIWLPAHIGTAGILAVEREIRGLSAHVRTNPPPTEALVPLVMVIAAYIGGTFAIRLNGWRRSRRSLDTVSVGPNV